MEGMRNTEAEKQLFRFKPTELVCTKGFGRSEVCVTVTTLVRLVFGWRMNVMLLIHILPPCLGEIQPADFNIFLHCGGNEVGKKLQPELLPAPASATVAVGFRLQHLELSTRWIVQYKGLRSCGVFNATLCVILQEACSCQQLRPQSTDHYG